MYLRAELHMLLQALQPFPAESGIHLVLYLWLEQESTSDYSQLQE